MHVDGDCCLSMAMRLSGSVRSAAIVIDGIEQTVPTWGPESWEEEKTQFWIRMKLKIGAILSELLGCSFLSLKDCI